MKAEGGIHDPESEVSPSIRDKWVDRPQARQGRLNLQEMENAWNELVIFSG